MFYPLALHQFIQKYVFFNIIPILMGTKIHSGCKQNLVCEAIYRNNWLFSTLWASGRTDEVLESESIIIYHEIITFKTDRSPQQFRLNTKVIVIKLSRTLCWTSGVGQHDVTETTVMTDSDTFLYNSVHNTLLWLSRQWSNHHTVTWSRTLLKCQQQ